MNMASIRGSSARTFVFRTVFRIEFMFFSIVTAITLTERTKFVMLGATNPPRRVSRDFVIDVQIVETMKVRSPSCVILMLMAWVVILDLRSVCRVCLAGSLHRPSVSYVFRTSDRL